METIVNELFHYNNFLVDQLEKVVNQFISFHCVTITKNNPRKQVSSRFLIYQLEKVLIDYIYIPLDAKIPRPYFSREQLHTFPVDRLENVFEKRQTFRRFSRKQRSPNNETRIGSFSKAGKASPHWETLTDRERHHCGGNFSEILDPGDDLFGCKWKKKKFPRQGFDTSSLDSAIFSSLRWRIGNLPASKPAALDVSLIESWNNVKLQIVPRLEKQSSRWNLLLTWSQTFLD